MTDFIDEFSDCFPDTATWKALSTRDEFGAPTFGAGTSYSGRLVRRHKMVRDAAGEEVLSTAHFWFQGAPAIDPDDEVTLSDGTTPPIVAIERVPDEDGACYTKVYF